MNERYEEGIPKEPGNVLANRSQLRQAYHIQHSISNTQTPLAEWFRKKPT